MIAASGGYGGTVMNGGWLGSPRKFSDGSITKQVPYA